METFCHSVFWDENICPLFGGVRCIEVSVNGGSTALIKCIHVSIEFVPAHVTVTQKKRI